MANSSWLQMYEFDREEYTLGPDSVTLYEGRTGIRILLSDIERYRQGAISLNEIAIQHLEQHTYMQQGHWHAVLQSLQTKTASMSTPEYIRKILIPSLEFTYHSSRDHATLVALRKTPIAEVAWLPLNVLSLPALLQSLQVEAAIWTPSKDGWCHITSNKSRLPKSDTLTTKPILFKGDL